MDRHSSICTITLLLLMSYCWTEVISSDYGCCHQCTENKTCGHQQHGNTCYYVFTDKNRTWEGNRQFCKSGNLRTVINPGQNLSVENILKELGSEEYLWLGGKVKDLKEWTFVNHISLGETYAKFDSGETFQCGLIIYSKECLGKSKINMKTVSCLDKHKFICRLNDWNGKPDLYISESEANWFEARSRCRSLGGDLFYLKANEHTTNVLKDKQFQSANTTFFIGLVHRRWEWEDGKEILFDRWQNGGPQNTSQDCLTMNASNGRWKEYDCNATLPTFCEGDVSKIPEKSSTNSNGTKDKQDKNVIISILGGLLGLSVLIIVCLATWAYRRIHGKSKQEDIYSDVILSTQGVFNPMARRSLPPIVNMDIAIPSGAREVSYAGNPGYSLEARAEIENPDNNLMKLSGDEEDHMEIVDNECYGSGTIKKAEEAVAEESVMNKSTEDLVVAYDASNEMVLMENFAYSSSTNFNTS